MEEKTRWRSRSPASPPPPRGVFRWSADLASERVDCFRLGGVQVRATWLFNYFQKKNKKIYIYMFVYILLITRSLGSRLVDRRDRRRVRHGNDSAR